MSKEIEYSRYCYKCKHANESEDSDICNECLTYPEGCDTHKPMNFVEAENHKVFPFRGELKKYRDYVYEVTYDSIDYFFAKKYYEEMRPHAPTGACSALRKGDLIGRNLDWTYDTSAEFVVHTPAYGDRHAVLGIASGLTGLTESFVSGGSYSESYKVLPFQLYDGINDAGVTVSILVVPAELGMEPSTPLISKKDDINGLMLTRFILDKFSSAREACEYVRDYVSVWFSEKIISDYGYILHYFVTDAEDTLCLEFVHGVASIVDLKEHPYVTNFYLTGITRNEDGSVYSPFTQDNEHDAIKTNGITSHGSGLERYNLINRLYSTLTGHESMRELLNKLFYTRSYNIFTIHPRDWWYTEFVGSRNLTCASPASDYIPVLYTAAKMHLDTNRRKKDTWQTVHSSIYSVSEKTLRIIFQEEDRVEYEFKL